MIDGSYSARRGGIAWRFWYYLRYTPASSAHMLALGPTLKAANTQRAYWP